MKRAPKNNPAAEAFAAGQKIVSSHPLFAGLMFRARVERVTEHSVCRHDGWALVTSGGTIYAHGRRHAVPEEWAYVLAHCLCHLAFAHFNPGFVVQDQAVWNTACDASIAEFLYALKIGRPPVELSGPVALPTRSEPNLYRLFLERGVPADLAALGTNGAGHKDMLTMPAPTPTRFSIREPDWPKLFGSGLSAAVTDAVDIAGGRTPVAGSQHHLTTAELARRWFVSSYPLLGSLAAGFKIIEDNLICTRMKISVAAVSAELQEIYINPAAGLDEPEMRFVMAHELLHVGLAHHARCRGRDHYLWNIACDYVINQWLIEMGVGTMPTFGLLYDPSLKGLSAESIYDRITSDLRTYRKLTTFRGIGMGDMLPGNHPDWWTIGAGCTLDEFYRRCLNQGLAYHQDHGRGLLPANLVEEIQAIGQPPVPWEVELARWFDDYFRPVEQMRTYARLSRRQSSTPDIVRPRWVPKTGGDDGRTFGVVIDTSGSIDRAILARALGAVASYSASRDVPAARVIFCDAMAYDEGFLSPDQIAGRVKVRGRGGTILQPGVDLLESAEDFPKAGPILIITDGICDKVRIRRTHAFLVPEGAKLPFAPVGPVFRMK